MGFCRQFTKTRTSNNRAILDYNFKQLENQTIKMPILKRNNPFEIQVKWNNKLFQL